MWAELFKPAYAGQPIQIRHYFIYGTYIMAMFKRGTGRMLSGMAGNPVVVSYRNGKGVLRPAPVWRKELKILS